MDGSKDERKGKTKGVRVTNTGTGVKERVREGSRDGNGVKGRGGGG